MNGPQAYQLLAAEMASYRALSYDELCQFIGTAQPRVVSGDDSEKYALQIVVRWHDAERNDILVDGWVALDECGPLHRIDEQFTVRKPRD